MTDSKPFRPRVIPAGLRRCPDCGEYRGENAIVPGYVTICSRSWTSSACARGFRARCVGSRVTGRSAITSSRRPGARSTCRGSGR